MKYTNYIKEKIGEFGTINASKPIIYQLSTIIECESKIDFFNSLEVDGEPNQYELERFQLSRTIAEITRNFEPDFCIPKIINGEVL